MRQFFKALFLPDTFFYGFLPVIILFLVASFNNELLVFAYSGLFVFFLFCGFELWLLFATKRGIYAKRQTPNTMSNGDDNLIRLDFENRYRFGVRIRVVDEVPPEFQARDFDMRLTLEANASTSRDYILRPVRRGEYNFGKLICYVRAFIGLVERRYTFPENRKIPVYPSYLQLRKFDFLAITERLNEVGVKKLRRLGHAQEFDHIRNYVTGDDQRTVNWKASARKNEIMVNTYTDERAQQIYAFIDMGRTMKMPFNRLSLLDYAINSALVLLNIAHRRADKPGLVTFSHTVNKILVAERKKNQMHTILELLYSATTNFLETDFERLYLTTRAKIKQRSLIVLYTNFESLSGLERNLPYLVGLNRLHLVCVIFFENTEVTKIIKSPAPDVEATYIKAIAEKYALDKRFMARELERQGIMTLLTTPDNLMVSVLNRYIEIKNRNLL